MEEASVCGKVTIYGGKVSNTACFFVLDMILLVLLYIGYKLGGVVGMIVAVPIGLIALTMYQEGALQTTKDSVKILTAGINHFRRLKPEDMDEVRQMQERDRRLSEELARQAAEEEAQKEAQKEARKEAFAKKQKEKKS